MLATQPVKGYRGFFDWNNYLKFILDICCGDFESEVYTGFTTSHGYQFNNWLYVGGGTGFMCNLEWKKFNYPQYEGTRFVIPVFAEGRLDGKWGKFTPYFSVQLGANLTHHVGAYFSPLIGYRFNWGRKIAINLGLGMTLFQTRRNRQTFLPGEEHDPWANKGPIIHTRPNFVKFTVRIGFEF